ncbi:MAG: PLP-dependent transferase [Ignavibacteriales bacterium]|nr:PLP-dependent transferase [Ignavibacteriales bacterium]
MHSTTKFLNGHSDSVGGVAVRRDADARRAGCGSCRTRPAPSCRRSTPGSCCAAPRRCALRMPPPRGERAAPWPLPARAAEGPSASSGPASRTIRATRCTSARRAASAR